MRAFGGQLGEMAMGYFRSRTLCAAARLGVADALDDGEKTVDELAAECKADRSSLYRLLRALAAFGIVTEVSPERFALTPLGGPLRKSAPDSNRSAVIFWADLLADYWSHLTESVRTGETAQTIMDREGKTSRWASDPEANAVFRAVMGTAALEAYEPIARAWDFSKRRVVADLGGGGGSLILAILETYPNVSGMLVERPESIEQAKPRFTEGAGLRCTLSAAELRDGVPTGADVYMLKHVLHGYTDDVAAKILVNCKAVLPPDGVVLVIEFVLPDLVNYVDADLEKRTMSDLNMLAVTGGKERSAREWKELLLRAGLEVRRVIPVPGDVVSIVEAGAIPD
jgi:hypothetical protein